MKHFNKKATLEDAASRISAEGGPEINKMKERALLDEVDRLAKLLIRCDLELCETREKQAQQLQEMDRIAKSLIRRDLELSETREKREKAFQQLEERSRALDDSRRALLNILEDIEEARIQAEQERDKTLAIITNFADGLLVFDGRNNLTLINPKAKLFLGINDQYLIGKSVRELSGIKETSSLMNLFGREFKEAFREELKLKDDLILEVNAAFIMREKEKLGALIILHDITREKLVEALKTEFVSLAAHQLRTPLSSIKWTLRMLLDGDLGKISREQKNFLEKTYLSNEKMIHLINDLLDVTRIEEGRFLYKLDSVRFEEVVLSVIKSYKEELSRRLLKLTFQKPKRPMPQVRADVEKIRVVVQNLLDNAVRYSPAYSRIRIALKQKKKELEFAINDQGIGIPKDQHARVFDKFFRGVNAVKTETHGSGLGLFIAKNIIKAHRGRIWFESEKGKGATFYFTLPIGK